MSTIEKRLAALEQEVAGIPRRGKWLASYERDLREAALQFARVKTGFYLESDGSRVAVSEREAADFVDLFRRGMETAAVAMLRELGIEERRS